MKCRLLILFLLLLAVYVKAQQKVIPLYTGAAPGSERWQYDEKDDSAANIAYNVSHPVLIAYLPNPAIATGTAVIVCPGGGFYILAMKEEGTDVAQWLNKKGVAVFILKYRLGQSLTNNPNKELGINMRKTDFIEKIKSLIPFSIADGREAIKYVRAHAAEFGVSPSRIGIMGFSAGGTVAASCAFNYNTDDRPDFVAPIYAYIPPYLQGTIAGDAPPMFLAAASDDQLGVATHSVDLYSKWLASNHHAELHIYQKGGHGFGMSKQGIPTDTWIDRFGDWLGLNGLLAPTDPKVVAHMAELEKNKKVFGDLLTKDWSFIKRYQAENSEIPAPAQGEKRVVFMGNSITEGWKNYDPAFFTGRPYYDRGISGQTTGQMLVRFREDVINLKPAVVVIMGGINDIAENSGPSKLEDVFGNIESMADLARSNHIKVVLSSVMPAYGFPWRPAIDPKPGVTALNVMIKDYCDKNNVVYLDYFTAMADERRGLPANLSKDGVHPNLEGYKIMEPLAEQAINKALGITPPKPTAGPAKARSTAAVTTQVAAVAPVQAAPVKVRPTAAVTTQVAAVAPVQAAPLVPFKAIFQQKVRCAGDGWDWGLAMAKSPDDILVAVYFQCRPGTTKISGDELKWTLTNDKHGNTIPIGAGVAAPDAAIRIIGVIPANGNVSFKNAGEPLIGLVFVVPKDTQSLVLTDPSGATHDLAITDGWLPAGQNHLGSIRYYKVGFKGANEDDLWIIKRD